MDDHQYHLHGDLQTPNKRAEIEATKATFKAEMIEFAMEVRVFLRDHGHWERFGLWIPTHEDAPDSFFEDIYSMSPAVQRLVAVVAHARGVLFADDDSQLYFFMLGTRLFKYGTTPEDAVQLFEWLSTGEGFRHLCVHYDANRMFGAELEDMLIEAMQENDAKDRVVTST